MKNLVLLAVMLSCLSMTTADSPVKDCRCKDVPLFGKVKIVTTYADFKVQIVDTYPDLEVKIVERYANSCGEWQLVDNYPDFTVQLVTGYPDFKIKFVTHYPGVTH